MSAKFLPVWTRDDIHRAAVNLGVDEFKLLDEVFELVDSDVVCFTLKSPSCGKSIVLESSCFPII
jgi:hypothetical protein